MHELGLCRHTYREDALSDAGLEARAGAMKTRKARHWAIAHALSAASFKTSVIAATVLELAQCGLDAGLLFFVPSGGVAAACSGLLFCTLDRFSEAKP